MKYQDAQEKSPLGIAVLGNPVMLDVLWPKGSPHPFMWIQTRYVAQAEGRWSDKNEWTPVPLSLKHLIPSF